MKGTKIRSLWLFHEIQKEFPLKFVGVDQKGKHQNGSFCWEKYNNKTAKMQFNHFRTRNSHSKTNQFSSLMWNKNTTTPPEQQINHETLTQFRQYWLKIKKNTIIIIIIIRRQKDEKEFYRHKKKNLIMDSSWGFMMPTSLLILILSSSLLFQLFPEGWVQKEFRFHQSTPCSFTLRSVPIIITKHHNRSKTSEFGLEYFKISHHESWCHTKKTSRGFWRLLHIFS